MKFLDIDSPFMNALGKMADLMWLNVLTLVCCIPIFTAGASLTAMHYMVLKIVRNEEGYITRGFFKSFKENFKQGTAIWFLLLFAVLVFAGDFYIIHKSETEFHLIIKCIIVAAAVLVVFTATFVFPVLAKFENTVKQTIKNAFVMSIVQFPKTILMIIASAVPVVVALLSYKVMPLVLLFGLSGPAWIGALLYNKFFKNLEEKILQESGENQEVHLEEEDERIFKDEIEIVPDRHENE
ncbi:MAG: DUF624 domain-containing protein [Lachnospiraceae bacterium]|nr:DUF624 domain-containing protein [Lachnospiraceae bacterium]